MIFYIAEKENIYNILPMKKKKKELKELVQNLLVANQEIWKLAQYNQLSTCLSFFSC